ncbi:MAG: hypothetical protein KDA67_00835 [Rhodobacteraceae bacterium]|nr:hypothetical protein [Paracoccaceae bacterium]
MPEYLTFQAWQKPSDIQCLSFRSAHSHRFMSHNSRRTFLLNILSVSSVRPFDGRTPVQIVEKNRCRSRLLYALDAFNREGRRIKVGLPLPAERFTRRLNQNIE